jgi:hypothetical protein
MNVSPRDVLLYKTYFYSLLCIAAKFVLLSWENTLKLTRPALGLTQPLVQWVTMKLTTHLRLVPS